MIGSRASTWLTSMTHSFRALTGRTLCLRIEGHSRSATSKERLVVAKVVLLAGVLAVAEAEGRL